MLSAAKCRPSVSPSRKVTTTNRRTTSRRLTRRAARPVGFFYLSIHAFNHPPTNACTHPSMHYPPPRRSEFFELPNFSANREFFELSNFFVQLESGVRPESGILPYASVLALYMYVGVIFRDLKLAKLKRIWWGNDLIRFLKWAKLFLIAVLKIAPWSPRPKIPKNPKSALKSAAITYYHATTYSLYFLLITEA